MVGNYHKLIKVEPDANNNKIYLIEKQSDGSYLASWGRVGSGTQSKKYSDRDINKKYAEKIQKGYVDITFNSGKQVSTNKKTGVKEIDNLFDLLVQNTSTFIKDNYAITEFTSLQIEEAQKVLDNLIKNKNKSSFRLEPEINNILRIIPRKISNVKSYIDLCADDLDQFISNEQDRLDSCRSSLLTNNTDTVDLISELDIDISLCSDKEYQEAEKIFNIGKPSQTKIINIFKTVNKKTEKVFNSWLENAKNKKTELLIHGTRLPNIISILKQGLLIRPSNAIHSGSAYGDGVYHSLHTSKSLGYTGNSNEVVLFLQKVHVGNQFVYEGWYRGNSFSLNYKELNSRGYDSTYVKPGNGLLNSEYIVYRSEQTTVNYLVHAKIR